MPSTPSTPSTPSETSEARISAVRHFNRFFTRQIGVLREGLLHSPYPLTEARIIFELAQRQGLTAADLGRELGLDAGYLSRLLARLEQQGLLEKVRSETDGRQRLLRLTPDGEQAMGLLDQRSRDEISEMLTDLSEEDQQRLLKAMDTIERIFCKGLKYSEPFVLRPHEPGDMGWVAHRHGVLYTQEYGWDEHFEALVAQIVSDFITHYNPERERCWIAEMNGEIVGSIFCVQASETVAKLRLLLVEPQARGLGLGSRLVEECIRFARRRGYQKLTLWTQSILVAARHIYAQKGFTLVNQEATHSFGHDLISETWELPLV
ncbi:MAG TPA: helix-turn-helix domain-containing GNAT family N-acetyltransferase [Ktedonobacterales bacterium]|nr:helix-turn-helix domain-containing GNAT family N-acetyltransferase [Ktedonobacterales bacterium]